MMLNDKGPINSLDDFERRCTFLHPYEAVAVRKLLKSGFIAAAIYLVEDIISQQNEETCDE